MLKGSTQLRTTLQHYTLRNSTNHAQDFTTLLQTKKSTQFDTTLQISTNKTIRNYTQNV